MILLDIGCGPAKRKGYVGIDKCPARGVDIVTPAHDLPYPDGEVDEIFTSHMIEHLPMPEFVLALKEWYRVLRFGGKLIIRCPNFELYVKEWLNGDFDHRWGWGIVNIYGHQNRGEGMITRNGFTVKRLKKFLPLFGFRIQKCKLIDSRQKSGPEYRKKGDIYCECIKA